jgi:SH3-like domain-containing protein
MDGTRQSVGRNAHRRPSPGTAGRRLAILVMTVLLPALSPALLASAVATAPRAARAAGDPSEGSGLPLPRFASLKSDHVNVRGGPNKDHDVAWVYTRPALPVEITAEFENWRRIRDRDGTEGWVYHTLLSGKRTAYVARQKTQTDLVPLHGSADRTSPLRAMLEPGVLGIVKRCNGQWCRFVGEGFDGWIEQSRLWGVYPNEKIE